MNCFCSSSKQLFDIELIELSKYDAWLKKQKIVVQQQLASLQFEPKPLKSMQLFDSSGQFYKVILTVKRLDDLYNLAHLSLSLPPGQYRLINRVSDKVNILLSLGWALGAYQFTRYKKAIRQPAKLLLDKAIAKRVTTLAEGCYLVRDLINTPACDMRPSNLLAVAKDIAKAHQASVKVVSGKTLEKDFPAVYAVGKSGSNPCVIELNWGSKAKAPHIVLAGKGVCFDTGGYDLKTHGSMSIMKKDMGGAAHVLALAQMIMSLKLPCRLTVLISAVENMVNDKAFVPGDVINTRKGLTVEIGNTDAEGRLVLSDALTYACEKKPDLLIDFATLTGAARVALGPEIATVLSNDDKLAQRCVKASLNTQDPCWQLPFFSSYRCWLNSEIADINNHSCEPFAGAITAALFLREFVDDATPWLHVDTYGWSRINQPGRPGGGEAIGLRAVLQLIEESLA